MSSSFFNRLLGLVLIAVLLGAGGRSLWVWLDQPIESVAVEGDFRYIDASFLSGQLSPLVSGQHWLSVDLDQLRERAKLIPWIHEARVSRHWPNALTFELEEQRPVAWWNDAFLINAEGHPFSPGPSDTLERMPNLAGPGDRSADVLAYYHVLEGRLAPLGLELTQLRLEARGAWRFQVNDTFWVILGRTGLDIRLERFLAAWHRSLSERADRIRYIDLRYPNGLAVGWHGESAAAEVSRQ
ncbi:cell division protein FtsQ/DivIB [Halotalea alkalilenta]|uniref:cell division protein FtsQ/DivIB n=1 Tax=Halotalea alkalilenta TaxID=376489 RepID=UPI0004819BC4|nr:cell division protein FtsQ/DivIB [Halotalea alkalilenta]